MRRNNANVRKGVRYLLLAGVLSLSFNGAVHAFEPFMVEDIRVEGLQRISAGTVFNYLPVKKGEQLDEALSSRAVRELFQTGFFKDVVLEREGNTLVVFVAERPAIANIEIVGNQDIPTDQLMQSLEQIGLAEGRVFNRSMLDKVEQELERQYLSRGKYGVKVKSVVTPLERNRVNLELRIAEGEVATIEHLNIVGNNAFSESELLDLFQLGEVPPLAILSDADQYSRQKLLGDLESLRSFYLDRGYINFDVESTQVSISPDKSQVYVTININEGEQYRVREVKVAGETIIDESAIRKLISVEPGEIFSRGDVTRSNERISRELGELGYAFANINPIPEIHEEDREVTLTFFIDPGKRAYVRRINISGNTKTQDEVLRREIRQMEGAPLETSKVERSRTRLNRLGFFDTVNVETPPVPGEPDQVDVNFDVKERDAFGSLNLGIGYGDQNGFLVNASVSQQNVLGTGNRFSLSVNNSKVNQVYSFSFTDPYFTMDGVSQSVNLFYRKTDTSQINIAKYSTDAYGAGLNYGIPLSEYTNFRIGLNLEHTELHTTTDTTQSILDFCSANATIENCAFDAYKANLGWSYDSRDRVLFPTEGTRASIGAEVAMPIGEGIEFYKLSYEHTKYWPILSEGDLVFMANGEVAYANSYGNSTVLPPFEKYYAGGARSVRGYQAASLGPRDELGDPLGGNARGVGNLELIFPAPFANNSDSVRLSLFLDGGTVYDTDSGVTADELRYSTGLTMRWITAVGALNFTWANALNDKAGDETEGFQFTLGAPF